MSLRVAAPAWMVCYVLLGFVQNGMVLVILPQAERAVAAGRTKLTPPRV